MDQMEVITTAEKIKNMNNLYRTAVRAMKSYFEFLYKPTPLNFKEMQEDVKALCKAIKTANHGNDPIGFISSTRALCEVASMQARGGAK